MKKRDHPPDIDVSLGEGGEHGGSNTLPGCHLMAHSRQHAAVVDLLYFADAAGIDGFAKPAASNLPTSTLFVPSRVVQYNKQGSQEGTNHRFLTEFPEMTADQPMILKCPQAQIVNRVF